MKNRNDSRLFRFQLLLALLGAGWLLYSGICAAEPQSRPASWAVKIDRPGLPMLHKVADGLYRGAQPTPEGIKELEKLGVKTIINLRSGHSDKDIVANSHIAIETIPLQAWSDPTEDKVVRFLKIVTDKNRQPVFVHCQRGADRTGTMCAVYRVAVQGWTKQQAIDEMVDGGFGFNPMWSNLPKFVENLNVEKVRAKAGPTNR
jgi:protein tyrosine phosphatase (PTP) superfamily phosphohydrolase (DUF442 family)